MRYRVHCYVTVRVPIDVDADTHEAAMKAATDLLPNDMRDWQDAEYAEEITGFLVDEDGDFEYAKTRAYDRDGKPERASP